MSLRGCALGVRRFSFVVSLILIFTAMARGQNAAPNPANATAAQAITGPTPRITGPIDETHRVTLRGNTHPLARAQYDQGAVADSQPLHRMLLLLQRSPAQESSLRGLLDQQQSKSSPSYHQWLTPQQFGQQFGPADSDVQTVASWLTSHGFQVNRVSAGKTVIEFSGTAGQVRQAFQTEIHRYRVNGEEHFANATDPSIPAALAPVVAGPVSLHNFPKKAQSRVLGLFRKNKSTGKVTPEPVTSVTGKSGNPLFTFPSDYCPLSGTCYALGPTDFATIYNVPTSGMPGSGQTIAIVGDSEICTANSPDWGTTSATSYLGPLGNTVTCGGPSGSDDVLAFRTLFGLPPVTPSCPVGQGNNPNYINGGPVCVIVDGTDPGFTYDETEGDLDTQWSASIARYATIDFVISADTESTAGIDLAAEYIVDNNLAPVVSESFGECEGALGAADNEFYYYLWEQAAAQGQTVIISAGDSGSAGCDDPDVEPPIAAQYGVFVNGIASTPFNVAAGGTDFNITTSGYPGSFWNSSNGTGEASVNASGPDRGYIPETTWNDSCAQSFSASLSACTNPTLDGLNIVGGGGGQSNCVVVTDDECEEGYAKPAWQGGSYVTGLGSTDGLRDVPDISFFAADGDVSGSFYIICEEDLSTDIDGNPDEASCSLSGTGTSAFTRFVGVGGTSSAAPAFAGTMALVNQAMTALNATNSAIPTRQGNANFVLYSLANAQGTSGCNSTSGSGSTCTFNDVTAGNNSVPCYPTGQVISVDFTVDDPNCNASLPTPYGLLEQENLSTGQLTGTIAWNTATGFDLATGLGTINVGNLINNWSSANGVGHFTPTTTSFQICGPATCTPATTEVSITHGQTVDLKIAVTPNSGNIPSSTTARPENASLIGSSSNTCSTNGAGVSTFTNIADEYNYEVVNANVFPLTTASGGSVSTPLDSTQYLVGGTYYVKAHYAGDGTFGASDSSNCVELVVGQEGSDVTVTVPILNFLTQGIDETLTGPSSVPVYYGDSVLLRASIAGATSGQSNATGTVQFKDNGVNYGSAVAVNTEGYAEIQTGANPDFFPTTPLSVGSHSITATYNGDSSYSAGTGSNTVSFTVSPAPTATYVSIGTTAIPPAATHGCSVAGGCIIVSSGTPVVVTVTVDTQNAANPSGGSAGGPTANDELLGTVSFTCSPACPTLASVPVTASSSEFDSNGFLDAVVSSTFTPSASVTVNATFTPSNANYVGSSSTAAGTVTVTSGTGFTISPLASQINCNSVVAPVVGCIAVQPGATGSWPITVTSTGLSGTVAFTCSVVPTNVNDRYSPACSFTTNGSTSSLSSSVTLTSGGNGTRYVTVTTTASTALGLPPSRPAPITPNLLLAGAALALAGCLFLLFGVSPRRRPAMALFVLLVVAAAGVAAGCAGPSSSISSSTSSASSGTTADVYTVVVTATPSTGTALQTEVELLVN